MPTLGANPPGAKPGHRWPHEAAPVAGRSCGSCSLCCKLLPVPELDKPAGQWCTHATRAGGCAIHAGRPQSCRRFFCAWMLDPLFGPEWKPETARFVLAADQARQALIVMVDPGMPLAWKRAPYYAGLKQLSERLFIENRRLLVNIRGQITLILPDRDVPLGIPPRGAEIAVWREGASYGAKLQPPRDEEALMRGAFIEAFEESRKVFGSPDIDDLAALTRIARDRTRMLDEAAGAYATVAGAQCKAGCTACCHLMVVATPFEVLSIARHLLETRSVAALEHLKQRLRALSEIPLDSTQRAKARAPCALLEGGRCSIYDRRPNVCRVMLSQSRAACESCLQGAGGFIPYIEPPSKIAAATQMGVDYALMARRKLSVELAELSRGLLIALEDCEGTLTRWLAGEDPFANAHVETPGAPSSLDKANAAARRFGVASGGE